MSTPAGAVFDPDAYLTQQSSSQPSFDPDAHLANAVPTRGSPSEPPIDARKDPYLPWHAAKSFAGSLAHGVGTLVDVATGTSPGPGSHAEGFAAPFAVPPTQQDIAEQDVPQWVSRTYDRLAGTGPLATTLKERIPQAAEAVGMVTGAGSLLKGIPKGTTPTVNSPQSISAAAATPNLATVSPELQQAISRAAAKSGGAVNPDVLSRHIEADSLPVKMQLTEGQATQNPSLISQEQNQRGVNPALAQRFNQQNAQLVQNVQALRDRVGPDVFTTNPVEHGDKLIESYKTKDTAAQADISSKYQALKDANGGQFPVDAKALLNNATSALHENLLYDHAPQSIMNTLGRLADKNNMTFENFEALRTNLARLQRSSSDGNEVAAAGVIRNTMEQLPLAPGAASLKPLADTARSAARAQFQALEADPAYKAAVNDSVSPDRFVQRFIVNGNRDDLVTMRKNFSDNPEAQQTMAVAALDHLKRSAGIDPMGNGNFSQAGFNKQLTALDPKLNSLVDPKTREDLQTLGNVARYTQAQPRGSFVNNSNTLVGALATHAANVAEGMANVKAGGFPIGTIVRKQVEKRSTAKAVGKALEPGAGLSRLSDQP